MENEFLILNQITPLAKTYLVPKKYFETLPLNILVKTKSKEIIYNIPTNYFDKTCIDIINKININLKITDVAEELNSIAPLLNTIKKSSIYGVPENYFEAISIKPLGQKTKIKALNLSYKWVKYAAAAVITGIIAVSVLFKGTDKQTLVQHKNSININIEKSILNVSDNDLSKELGTEETAIAGVDDVSLLPFQNITNTKEEMQFVSDEEIENYMKENKTPTDNINLPNS